MALREVTWFLALTLTVIDAIPDCKEPCVNSVLGRRQQKYRPEWSRLSLSCVVQHCGGRGWTGGWGRFEENQFFPLSPTPRHRFHNRSHSDNCTVLSFEIFNISQYDAGSYQCRIRWAQGHISNGHVVSVNVTEAVPERAGRTVLGRVLVCAGPCLGFPLVLVLVLVRCLRSRSPPRPPPRRSRPVAVSEAEPRTELQVTYAAIAVSPGSTTSDSRGPPAQKVIYAALRFPRP